MSEKWRKTIIEVIDIFLEKLPMSAFTDDLQKMRAKYIYKDVPTSEINVDLEYLNNIKKIIVSNYGK